jgi:hypothetical protein
MDVSVVVSYSTAKSVATSYLKNISLCTICGSRSGVADDSFPLGSDTITCHKVPDILTGHGTSVF